MPYAQFPLPGFAGGLNLRDRADVVNPSQAVDLLNVTFTERGAVKSRDGYAALTSATGTNRYDSLSAYYRTGAAAQLVAGAGNRLEVISAAGAVVASSTLPTANPHYFVRFGSPGAERVYIANGTDTVRYVEGSTFTTPAYTGTTPTGRFLAVKPGDNRLVCARFGGTTAGSNPYSVRFSGAGDPHTFGADDYVDLDPGDGEAIMGVAVWRDYLFVFKESRFYVFGPTATNNQGAPEFDYRTVASGAGLVASRALAVGRDGVYFMDRKGVYRTRGGEPELLSTLVEPIWSGEVANYYLGGVLNHAHIDKCAMTWHDERVYLAYPSGSATVNDRMLVHDPRYGWWTLYTIPAAAVVPFRVGSTTELVFAYASGSNHIGRHSSAYDDDAGTDITTRWRGGWTDLGTSDMKTVREVKLWGVGTVNAALGVDFGTTGFEAGITFSAASDFWGDGTGADTWGDGTGTDTWAAAASLEPQLYRESARGTVFSLYFTSTDPWAVHRATAHVRGRRIAPVIKAAA